MARLRPSRGLDSPGGSGDTGPASSATLFLPTDVAVDTSGAVYSADQGAVLIRKVAQGIISTVAGNTTTDQVPQDNALAISVRIGGPTGVAVDSSGAVYFAAGSIGSGSGLDTGDFKIWKVTPDGFFSTVAGNGYNNFSGDGGLAVQAQPRYARVNGARFGRAIYFADPAANRVRKIATDGTITTVAL